jgi:hypothetical protein
VLPWTTISSLATAAGTLVLAVATFSAVRSGNRSARVAERSLLAGQRPLLVASLLDDAAQKINFIDGHWVSIPGGHGTIEAGDDVMYLALSLRNAGSGIAVLQSWHFTAHPNLGAHADHADLTEFRRLSRDIYVPAGGIGFWQGALRDPFEPAYAEARGACEGTTFVTIQLLYGDQEGGQRTISLFTLSRVRDDTWLANVSRHWMLDRPNPRD